MSSVIYLLNAPVITDFGLWRFNGPLSLDEVRLYLGKGFVSGIGHQVTAEFLTALLAIDCPFSRSRIIMQPGDTAVVFQLLERLPEGKLLNAHEIGQLPYLFGLLSCEKLS